jgi:hypothetical protein
MEPLPDGKIRLRRTGDVGPFASSDPDSKRVFWRDGGVHQNLTFPVQPDPISGMHCWHQLVTVTRAAPGDRYGDVVVDPDRAMAVYREWLAKVPDRTVTPDNLRRPRWFARAFRPADAAWVREPDR